MPGVKTEFDRDYDPSSLDDDRKVDLLAEDAAERALRRRYCSVCKTYGGHTHGCPETPEPEESNGE
jgi:hypothetical protein